MSDVTLRETGTWASGDAEASSSHSEGADILLGLEEDDVDLWSKEAAQHNRPTQTNRNAHGGGLHLERMRGKKFIVKVVKQWSIIIWFRALYPLSTLYILKLINNVL